VCFQTKDSVGGVPSVATSRRLLAPNLPAPAPSSLKADRNRGTARTAKLIASIPSLQTLTTDGTERTDIEPRRSDLSVLSVKSVVKSDADDSRPRLADIDQGLAEVAPPERTGRARAARSTR
jgi:hypothetical protein